MDRQTKKMIGFAAVGWILYELWKRNQAAGGPTESIQTDNMSPVPVWAQQLSATGGTTTSTIEDLMSIPQGPGGTPGAGYGNFFAGADCILPPIA